VIDYDDQLTYHADHSAYEAVTQDIDGRAGILSVNESEFAEVVDRSLKDGEFSDYEDAKEHYLNIALWINLVGDNPFVSFDVDADVDEEDEDKE
jgi:hypothetical protein